MIEKEAFTLIGASTKRDDSSKIGFFGSGLKYSLAVLLRNNTVFQIYSGMCQIKVDTKQTMFRDKIFNQILIEGQETGFTKEMGVDWEPWFPIREIYCNALDENNGSISYVDRIEPVDGETHFYIQIDDKIRKILDDWNDYFTNKRTDIILDCPEIKVFYGAKGKNILYRKGVQCDINRCDCLFHYDMPTFKINESRTLKDKWEAFYDIANALGKYATKDMIRMIYEESTLDNIEGCSVYWSSCIMQFNRSWIEVINGRKLVPRLMAGHFAAEVAAGNCLILNNNLLYALKRFFKEEVTVLGGDTSRGTYVIKGMTDKQLYKIDEALKFLEKNGIKMEWPIEIAAFSDHLLWGEFVENKILLSERVFEQGMKKLVETIYEEWAHGNSGLCDKTRSFQDFLVTKIITAMEEKVGIYL